MDSVLNEPVIFEPYFKSVIWGGDKIAEFKNVTTELHDIGESWEISAVPGFESIVAEGQLKGMNISDLINRYGVDFLGTKVIGKFHNDFPLLVKIIDARADLSVQVHPDDALAAYRHNSPGKSEMWYIIDRLSGAKIYSGLRAELSPESYCTHIANNSIMEVVGVHESEPGQFYYVPAGTLHAIGAGNLLAEIQQTSDITYRVYDYGRRDAEGNTRELHTELAKDAIDYRYPNDIFPTATTFGVTTEGVVTSPYFKTDFLNLHEGEQFEVFTEGCSFAIIMVTEGVLTITRNTDGRQFVYSRGSTVLLPAAMPACTLSGSTKALLVTMP
ncbi:MAG: mannose-6-phosphate isomerase [Muribaculaceae bacterium]|nr:mannose-6-phosphate isomerase [Muribaculaceae bacterium]